MSVERIVKYCPHCGYELRETVDVVGMELFLDKCQCPQCSCPDCVVTMYVDLRNLPEPEEVDEGGQDET